ncbi:MAG: LytR C-terminal domain-containing protein, partial [Parcubacteria group bacterium]|nr:LytR C-terminal domain-containing protein [Parcubacteria group bacterium]
HIETDMELWQLVRLYDIGKSIDQSAITQVVLSTDPGGLLSADTDETGAYLLRPRAGSGDFSEIQSIARSILADAASIATQPVGTPLVRIAIQNGTWREGLAASASLRLQTLPFRITQVSNANRRDYERTVIYKLSSLPSDEDVQLIRQTLNANVAPAVPEFIQGIDADVLIIVGADGAA